MVSEDSAFRRPRNAQRRWKALTRKLRELGSIASALLDTGHPYMAHVVPMRRCNLACTYCNEFDDVSDPVSIEEMERRIDELGRLGTSVITISGGEPLLHPELDRVIARIRRTGAIAGMITNGYLLMPKRIERLNRAGLDHMQISIDNVMPDEVSKKSLKVLDAKLKMLAEHADFHVNINSVVGGGIAHPSDALTVSERALALGFSSTIGIIHDGSGQLKPLGEAERTVWDKVRRLTLQPFPGGDRQRPAERLAMPRGQPLSLHLRVRPGALLLTAARIPRCAAGPVRQCGLAARVPHPEELRAQLHHQLRASGQLHRPLARSANLSGDSRRRTWNQRGSRCGSGAATLIFATPLARRRRKELIFSPCSSGSPQSP
jgi:hypothetical protein